MKLHFRSVDGSILSVAYKCQQEGVAEVTCSIAETEENAREQYKGLLKFYHDNWQSKIDRDTVVIYDQVSRGEEADRLKDAGFAVIGAGRFNDRLELDRAFAMEWTQQHGINIPETWTFTDYNEAIEFIKDYPGRLVFKPSGTLPSEATYVSQDEGNADLLYHLERLEHLSKGAEFILQKVVEGIEISTEGWYYRGALIPPPNATMEEKKLMTGTLGPTVGCFTADTEILTQNGWKSIADVAEGELVLSMNPLTYYADWFPVKKTIKQLWSRPLIHWKGYSIDILVTDNHNMVGWISPDYKKKELSFRLASQIPLQSHFSIPRTAKWKGKTPQFFEIPIVGDDNLNPHSKILPPIPIDKWVKFMGLFLSEGWINKKAKAQYRIGISQKSNNEIMSEVLNSLPLSWTREKTSWTTMSEHLGRYLIQFGKSYQKYIPQEIKELSPELLNLFLDFYTLGDGIFLKNGTRIIYTSSKRMADDLQEIFLKCGSFASIFIRNRIGKPANLPHRGIIRHLQYEVIEHRRTTVNLRKASKEFVEYNGYVYCVEVPPHHTIYVRRNGQPFWCGNCAGNVVWVWHPNSYMYDHTLKKLEMDLVKEDYTGTLDINTIYVPEENRLYALEYCARFGYAGIENLCSLIQASGASISEVFWNWGMGKLDALPVMPLISVAVVITIPRGKDGVVPKHEYIGGAIDYTKFFWGDVQLDKKSGNLVTAGVDGIIATLVEVAPTVDEALAKAYSELGKLILSNKQYRIDIGQRYKQQFPIIERVDKKYSQIVQRMVQRTQ